MKQPLKLFLAVIALIGFSILCFSCIHNDTSDCPAPELLVTLQVADKNYQNILDHPFILPLSEDLPFKSYVKNLYFRLTYAKTGEVFSEGYVDPKDDEKEVKLVIKEIPQGEYELTVWGNVPSDTTQNDLDTYKSQDKISITSNRSVSITRSVSRTKGLVYVSIRNFPQAISNVQFSTDGINDQEVIPIPILISSPKMTKASTIIIKNFSVINHSFSEFMWNLPPSTADGSQMSVSIFKGNNQINIKKSIFVSIARNRISAYNLTYDPLSGEIIIEVWSDNRWKKIHNLSLV